MKKLYIFVLIFVNALAQNNVSILPCVHDETADFERQLRKRKPIESRNSSIPEDFYKLRLNADGSIPVIAHIVMRDFTLPTGMKNYKAISEQNVSLLVDALNEEYFPEKLTFSLEKINYIQDSENKPYFDLQGLRLFTDFEDIESNSDMRMKSEYVYLDEFKKALNIFFVFSYKIRAVDFSCGSSSYVTQNYQGIVLPTYQLFDENNAFINNFNSRESSPCVGRYDNPDVKTLLHEVGHFFGLQHPHAYSGDSYAWPGMREQVSRSTESSEKRGDSLSDTAADYGLNSQNVNQDCQYVGDLKDDFGTPLNPDTSLLMSYAPKSCVNRFTEQQKLLMLKHFDFRTKNNSIKRSAKHLKVSPNPARAGEAIRIYLPELDVKLSNPDWNYTYNDVLDVRVFDINGKLVKENFNYYSSNFYYSRNIDEVFLHFTDTHKLTPGMYFVRVSMRSDDVRYPLRFNENNYNELCNNGLIANSDPTCGKLFTAKFVIAK